MCIVAVFSNKSAVYTVAFVMFADGITRRIIADVVMGGLAALNVVLLDLVSFRYLFPFFYN